MTIELIGLLKYQLNFDKFVKDFDKLVSKCLSSQTRVMNGMDTKFVVKIPHK